MLSELKPVLTALVLPPTSPLLLIVLGLLVRKRPRVGRSLVAAGVLVLWLLSCSAVSVWLNRHAVTNHPVATVSSLQAAHVQALVVLGGGLETDLPDGVAQLSRHSLDRLRQAAQLARASSLPIAFSGGLGWSAASSGDSEASVAARVAQDAFGLTLRWQESTSRDTLENAQNTFKLLSPDGVQRIGLVTDSWHMARSVQQFERAGFTVTPVPMGHPGHNNALYMHGLPSAEALGESRQVLREALGLWVANISR